MPIAELTNSDISFVDEGEGPAILLIHGFASNKEMNWIGPGWVRALTKAGYRVVALDNRGHGESSKFYEEDDYKLVDMAGDAFGLLDYLKIDKAHVMGYSMGARITCTMAITSPERIENIVLGGNGFGIIEGTGDWEPVRQALLAQSVTQVSDPRGRAFRLFAEKTKADLPALAACVIGNRQLFTKETIGQISNNVLVAIGSEDDLAGSGPDLVEVLPKGQFLEITGRDHMLAVGDKVYITGVLDYLASN